MTHATRRSLMAGAALVAALATTPVYADHHDDPSDDPRQVTYNSEYIFAATRAVTDMNVPPVWKIPLIPVSLAFDLAALPIAAIAGLF